MSDEKTMIYISPKEDLTSVRERLEKIPAHYITLVIPTETELRSHVAWKLLRVRVRELGKEVLIVSDSAQVRAVARSVNFKVSSSLDTSPPGTSRPPRSRSTERRAIPPIVPERDEHYDFRQIDASSPILSPQYLEEEPDLWSEETDVAKAIREAASQVNRRIPYKTSKAVKIFYCYAHEDKLLRDELAKHLHPLIRKKYISEWFDREIQPGEIWKQEIKTQLDIADIILLLVSADFISSDYCYDVEMERAIERHRTGHAHVIPIILRPAHWEETPIGELQALPTGAKPVTSWLLRDEAFLDIVRGIRKVVGQLLSLEN